jgi:hypothetical protein
MAACKMKWLLLFALVTQNGLLAWHHPAVLARHIEEPAAAARDLLAASGVPSVNKINNAPAKTTQAASTATYKTGTGSKGGQLFMCIVVGGAQCANTKGVLKKRLGEDVKQVARRMGIKTGSLTVTTTSIDKVGLLCSRLEAAACIGSFMLAAAPQQHVTIE